MLFENCGIAGHTIDIGYSRRLYMLSCWIMARVRGDADYSYQQLRAINTDFVRRVTFGGPVLLIGCRFNAPISSRCCMLWSGKHLENRCTCFIIGNDMQSGGDSCPIKANRHLLDQTDVDFTDCFKDPTVMTY